MTVADLIAQLERMPPDADVSVYVEQPEWAQKPFVSGSAYKVDLRDRRHPSTGEPMQVVSIAGIVIAYA